MAWCLSPTLVSKSPAALSVRRVAPVAFLAFVVPRAGWPGQYTGGTTLRSCNMPAVLALGLDPACARAPSEDCFNTTPEDSAEAVRGGCDLVVGLKPDLHASITIGHRICDDDLASHCEVVAAAVFRVHEYARQPGSRRGCNPRTARELGGSGTRQGSTSCSRASRGGHLDVRCAAAARVARHPALQGHVGTLLFCAARARGVRLQAAGHRCRN